MSGSSGPVQPIPTSPRRFGQGRHFPPVRARAALLDDRARVRSRLCRAQTGRRHCVPARAADVEPDQAHRPLHVDPAPGLHVLLLGFHVRRGQACPGQPEKLPRLQEGRHHRLPRRSSGQSRHRGRLHRPRGGDRADRPKCAGCLSGAGTPAANDDLRSAFQHRAGHLQSHPDPAARWVARDEVPPPPRLGAGVSACGAIRAPHHLRAAPLRPQSGVQADQLRIVHSARVGQPLHPPRRLLTA